MFRIVLLVLLVSGAYDIYALDGKYINAEQAMGRVIYHHLSGH